MIKFSTRGEYGIRMMVQIARHYKRGPVALSEVARLEDLPLPYLEQLVGRLRKANLLTSHHGAHGGYELTRAPEQITMGDVLRALEGPIAPMVCASEMAADIECSHQSFCTVSTVWARVRDAVAQALDSITLADLVPPKEHADWLRSSGTIIVVPAPGSSSTTSKGVVQYAPTPAEG
jgi:Rrf2 family cysteine metabolism transcriptional repressor